MKDLTPLLFFILLLKFGHRILRALFHICQRPAIFVLTIHRVVCCELAGVVLEHLVRYGARDKQCLTSDRFYRYGIVHMVTGLRIYSGSVLYPFRRAEIFSNFQIPFIPVLLYV